MIWMHRNTIVAWTEHPLQINEGPETIYQGSPAARDGTTYTTTWMQAQPRAAAAPVLRVTLLHAERSITADLTPPYVFLERVILRLLEALFQGCQTEAMVQVALAATQPPAIGYVQEVVLVVNTDSNSVGVAWDARPVGGALRLQLAALHTHGSAVLWHEAGWQVAINGVPEAYQPRNLRTGDLVHPCRDLNVHRIVPVGVLYDLAPALEAFAWTITYRGPIQRLANAFTARLRMRRYYLGPTISLAQRASYWDLHMERCDFASQPTPPPQLTSSKHMWQSLKTSRTMASCRLQPILSRSEQCLLPRKSIRASTRCFCLRRSTMVTIWSC